jgi:hypothetical protein
MSQPDSQGAVLNPADLSALAYETLLNLHGQSQRERVQGCFISQALRELLEFVDAEQIIGVQGRRRINTAAEKEPLTEALGGILEHHRKQRETAAIAYDRASHGPFPGEAVQDWLDDNDNLYDIPVTEFVFRFTDAQLREHLWELIQATVQAWSGSRLTARGAFEGPFYAVLEAAPPGLDYLREQIVAHHPDRYYRPTSEGGLGWSTPRPMHLTALWSHQSFADTEAVVAKLGDGTELTMHDIEAHIINQTASEERQYGAINSKLSVNKWRAVFGRGVTNTKRYEWRSEEGWLLVGDGDD